MSFSVIKATAITVIFKTARRIQLKRKSLLILEAFYFNKSLLIVRIYSQKRSPVPCVLATFLIQTAVPPCQKPPSTFSKVWLQLLSSSNAACCHLLVKQLWTQEVSTFNLILIIPPLYIETTFTCGKRVCFPGAILSCRHTFCWRSDSIPKTMSQFAKYFWEFS